MNSATFLPSSAACASAVRKWRPAQMQASVNGGCYRCRVFGDTLAAAGMRPIRTRPYSPRTNGKAEPIAVGPTDVRPPHRQKELPR
jgi:hypothetical protein